MRIANILFAVCLLFCVTTAAFAAEKTPKPAPGAEKHAEPTGSLNGSIHAPDKEAPQGCIAELHEGGAGAGASIYYLYADGSVAKQLKDLAKKGASATISGVITEKGYRVTSISNIAKPK